MPATPFKKLIGLDSLGLSDIEHAAKICKTSLTATAIRYSELTDDAIAIIMSTGHTIDYCIMSEAMKSLPNLSWLKRGSRIPLNTATAQFNNDTSRVLRGERIDDEIDILNWFDGKRSSIFLEEVIGLGSYGKTLTVLSSQNIAQEIHEEDSDNEEELIDSWTPRFKR